MQPRKVHGSGVFMGAAPVWSKSILSSLSVLAGACLLGSLPVCAENTSLDPAIEARIDTLLPQLTLAEKISMVHADSKFTSAAVPRLGIPRRWLSDGPHGVREEVGPDTWNPAGRTDDFSTAMPAGIALAASWNPDLAQQEGTVIGDEARKRGKDIMLGPGVNILRTPLCGRNFEYLGEDPWLSSRMAVGYIQGVQSRQVASCVKHFAANNQEFERGSINVEMDERTLREIYLPAFKAAVQEAGVWSIMGAYNQFRGAHCCENDYLLNHILKDEWGFKGLVMSDWDGVHNTRGAVLGGMDLEMGTEKPYHEFYLADAYAAGVSNGTYSQALLDDKVRRNLRVMLATGAFGQRPEGSINTPQHQAIARKVAEEGLVLLKNTGDILPLDAAKIHSIAVIGDNATRLQTHGGQSSEIKAFYEITPLQGILNRVGKQATITFAQGYQKGGVRAQLTAQAIAAAKQAEVVIFVGGLNHDIGNDCESADRKNLQLPEGQAELIQQLVAVNPRTIVVLNGTMVEMSDWLGSVPALLQAWYGGMESGNAIARVLFGDVNPSGKLPCTFPKHLTDSPAHALNAYPGTNGTVTYAEGLLVGYRWFDTKAIEPLFPFGYGLSYTHFEYSDLKLIPGADGAVVAVEFTLANTGARAGAEVAQIYVHEAQSALPRPVHELKAFQKVSLNPGEQKKIHLPLARNAFAYYSPDQHGWVAEAGDFTIQVGASSRDIRLQDTFKLATTTLEK